MKLPLIITFLFVYHVAQAQDTSGFKIVWSDEFNVDGAPNTANWNYETGFVRNEELQWYQPENAYCKDGNLVIEARREHKANSAYDYTSTEWQKSRKAAEYTSACLITKHKQSWLYGRFVMRARFDVDSGLWPAWWTLGTKKMWPSNGEIDIMEYYRGNLLANIACLNGNGKPEWFSNIMPVDSIWASQFHVWQMDWNADSITISVDNHTITRVPLNALVNKDGNGYNPFKQKQYMLLDLAIGGQNGGDPKLTNFPKKLEVDYVRVYQKQ